MLLNKPSFYTGANYVAVALAADELAEELVVMDVMVDEDLVLLQKSTHIRSKDMKWNYGNSIGYL